MKANEAKELRELRTQHQHLKKIVANQAPEINIWPKLNRGHF